MQQGVDFVLKNFHRMRGGEIYVPKIPSMHITDLAESLAPGMATTVIGIRPGEKLHEVMCPIDDSHLTLEFEDHYVIQPSIKMFHSEPYSPNRLCEEASPVKQGFEYSSGTNAHFLGVDELRDLNEQS